ncbi:MAG: bifunctional 2-keto-4-hydroxyglutarate aldolase/2-keto-3-deoxy-6-phosphogluconate aldolase [Planctomycetes bacterium]|nr:bifunctional 2-keto-4-hydroxyglutarate aldolase/2-keto-3-deoxy-6-phosphogluconate aldolase [Planctomycetota bacterium]
MSKLDDIQRMIRSGIVAVVRAPNGEGMSELSEALAAGGVDAIEITFTVPKAHHVLEEVASRVGDRILLGAGTVLDPETARIAILAGARFIVSPTINLEVIRLCHRYDRVVVPGAMTPTEVLTAWEAGADVVKIFPSEVVGPAYFKAIHGPLPQVRLMPSGGVNLQTAADFLRAGAAVLSVGGALVDPAALASREFSKIEATARKYVEIVRQFRGA